MCSLGFLFDLLELARQLVIPVMSAVALVE
jgi:hypothetical protein